VGGVPGSNNNKTDSLSTSSKVTDSKYYSSGAGGAGGTDYSKPIIVDLKSKYSGGKEASRSTDQYSAAGGKDYERSSTKAYKESRSDVKQDLFITKVHKSSSSFDGKVSSTGVISGKEYRHSSQVENDGNGARSKKEIKAEKKHRKHQNGAAAERKNRAVVLESSNGRKKR